MSSATDFWINPAGGDFNLGTNWDTGVRHGGDINDFNLASSAGYTALLGTNSSATEIDVLTDKVTIDLATYQLNFFGYSVGIDFKVGTGAGQNGALTLSGTGLYNGHYGWRIGLNGGTGSLTFNVPGTTEFGEVVVGQGVGSNGTFTINKPLNPQFGSSIAVGSAGGNGTLNVAAFYKTHASVHVGDGIGSVGTINVTTGGDFGQFISGLYLGENGGSGVFNGSGGSTNCSAFDLGGGVNRGGLTASAGLGKATLTNFILNAGSLDVGDQPKGDGTLIMSNSTAFFNQTAGIGLGGTGKVTVSGKSSVKSIEVFVGGNGGNGSLAITGPNTSWSITTPQASFITTSATIGADTKNVPGKGIVDVSDGASWNLDLLLKIADMGSLSVGSGGTVNAKTFAMSPGASITFGEDGTSTTVDGGLVSLSSTATLAGTLNVQFLGNLTPFAGEDFNLFDFASETGTFSAINLPALPQGLQWDTSNLYVTGNVDITSSVPEPATGGLLITTALFAAKRRRTR